jgi:hypothetical protein
MLHLKLLLQSLEFGKALDEGKEIRVVFCDISKAFDRIWHIGLLKKLESIIRYKLVSSANSFIVDCISVTMSFIKIINKRGPSIEPWGNKPDHPPLYMDSNDISTVSEHKHLELVISDNRSWEKHIDMITGKA